MIPSAVKENFTPKLIDSAAKRNVLVAYPKLSLEFHSDKNLGKEDNFQPKFVKVRSPPRRINPLFS